MTSRIVSGVDVDFFASSPIDDPLSYPGLIPAYSYVLTGPRSLVPVTSVAVLPLAGRRPVIAVGSNAAPAQLARKFFALLGSGVPVLRAFAPGLRVLPSAHMGIHGYLASAPSRGPDEVPVFVTFLDAEQLVRLDETEPNYIRSGWPGVRLADSDEWLDDCDIYFSKHGMITDERVLSSGQLPAQPELLAQVLALLPDLGAQGVSSVAELVSGVRERRLDPSWVTGLIKSRLATAPPAAHLRPEKSP